MSRSGQFLVLLLASTITGLTVAPGHGYAHRIKIQSVRAYMKTTGTEAERSYRRSIRSQGFRILDRTVYVANCYRDPYRRRYGGPVHVHEVGCEAGVSYELDPNQFPDVYYWEDESRFPDRVVAMYFVGSTFYCGDRSRITRHRVRGCYQMQYGLNEPVYQNPSFSPKIYDSSASIGQVRKHMLEVIRND